MAHVDPFHDIDPLDGMESEAKDLESESDYEDDDGNIFSTLEDDSQ